MKHLIPVVLISLAGCAAGRTAEPGEEELAPAVEVASVQRAHLEERITAVAHLGPSAQVRLYSPVSERILSFPFEDGDVVSRGQRVATIRSESLDRGLEQMAAQIEALDAQIAAQEADLARTTQLLEAEVVTPQAYDQASAALSANRAQRRSLVASESQLAVSRGYTLITAPIDGVLAYRQLQVGDWASPQVPLATLMSVDPLILSLSLMEEDVAKVRPGQSVELVVDAWPGLVFSGEVRRVMPWMDATTHTNTVEAEVANPVDAVTGRRRLKPGMYGTAALVVDERADALVAPERAFVVDAEALAQGGRRAFVVDERGRAHGRIVMSGARTGDRVEVLSGLEEGEQVVIRGQHELVDGEQVRVVSTVAVR